MRRNFLAIALISMMGSFAQAQELGRNPRAIAVGRHGTAALEFDLDEGALRQGAVELQLRLPGEDSAPAQLLRAEFQSRGGRSAFWRGTVALRNDSEVMLTLHEGYLAGTIRIGTDVFEVRPSLNGHVVEKINPASYPACAGSPDPGLDAGQGGSLTRKPGSLVAAGSPTLSAAGAVEIDLLSVYSPQARAAVGGPAQMAAVIQAAVDAANRAFANSGVRAVYRLVGTAEAAHDDSGQIADDLGWLAHDAAIAMLRDQAGADLVSLIVENGGGSCGIGYGLRSDGPGLAEAGFQVTARSCALGNLSLAHEHGHNLGLEHDSANGPMPAGASYPWSFGYLVNGVFRTVMAEASACANGCTALPYFSNPDVTYLGYPTGAANVSDNARTANATAAIVSAFRSPITVQPKATQSKAYATLSDGFLM